MNNIDKITIAEWKLQGLHVCHGCGQDVMHTNWGVWKQVIPNTGMRIDEWGNAIRQQTIVNRSQLPNHCVKCATELVRCGEVTGRVVENINSRYVIYSEDEKI